MGGVIIGENSNIEIKFCDLKPSKQFINNPNEESNIQIINSTIDKSDVNSIITGELYVSNSVFYNCEFDLNITAESNFANNVFFLNNYDNYFFDTKIYGSLLSIINNTFINGAGVIRLNEYSTGSTIELHQNYFHNYSEYIFYNDINQINPLNFSAFYNAYLMNDGILDEISNFRIENPWFMNESRMDYHIMENSDLIDLGDPSFLDPDNTPSDIGAFYFHQINGDVNLDGNVDVWDILYLVDFILNNVIFDYNQLFVSDLDSDNQYDVIDVLLLIQLILNQDINITNPSNVFLAGIIESMEDGQRYKYNIDMLNEQDVYILHFELQFDNIIPLNAIKGIRSDEMSVNYNIIADEYKINIMIFSAEGRKIPAGYGTILEIELETTALGREGELTKGSEFVITDLANNPETLIPVEIVSADELSRLADEKLNNLIPEKFALHPVFPNPFNPTATIRYDLPQESHVSLQVFNLNGQLIDILINSNQSPGMYELDWNAEHLPRVAYFIKMKTESYTKTQKVMLVK